MTIAQIVQDAESQIKEVTDLYQKEISRIYKELEQRLNGQIDNPTNDVNSVSRS